MHPTLQRIATQRPRLYGVALMGGALGLMAGSAYAAYATHWPFNAVWLLFCFGGILALGGLCYLLHWKPSQIEWLHLRPQPRALKIVSVPLGIAAAGASFWLTWELRRARDAAEEERWSEHVRMSEEAQDSHPNHPSSPSREHPKISF